MNNKDLYKFLLLLGITSTIAVGMIQIYVIRQRRSNNKTKAKMSTIRLVKKANKFLKRRNYSKQIKRRVRIMVAALSSIGIATSTVIAMSQHYAAKKQLHDRKDKEIKEWLKNSQEEFKEWDKKNKDHQRLYERLSEDQQVFVENQIQKLDYEDDLRRNPTKYPETTGCDKKVVDTNCPSRDIKIGKRLIYTKPQIKKFRKCALKLHPDKNPNCNKQAEHKMQAYYNLLRKGWALKS
jgi:hypothetical protein